MVLLSGVPVTVKVAHVRLCHSRMMFVRAYPRETQEMVFDAHDRAFALFKGTCRRGIYDNMKTAVETVFVGKDRLYNRRFLQMCSHHLVEPVACTPASGREKGQVENQVGLVRERFFTPRLRQKLRRAQRLAHRQMHRLCQGASTPGVDRADDLGGVRGRARKARSLCWPVRWIPCRAGVGLEDLPGAVEAACAEAMTQGVHSADVVLNILARQRTTGPPVTILTPAALTLRHAPIADCARYDNLRRTI